MPVRSTAAPAARTPSRRERITGAFTALVLAPFPYERIRVADIAARAGVARSTFYTHYRTKEDVLADSLRGPFTRLARCGTGTGTAPLQALLEHFWDNRAQARVIFDALPRRTLSRLLAHQVLASMREQAVARGLRAALPLHARGLAEMQLGVIAAWLRGDLRGAAADIVAALTTAAAAVRRALRADAG